jgi:hypothetical protein
MKILKYGLLAACLAASNQAQAQQTLLPVSAAFATPQLQGVNDFLPIENSNQWGLSGSEGADYAVVELPSFPPHDQLRGTTNGFFDASQYTADCSGSIFIANDPGAVIPGNFGQGFITIPGRQVRLCSATSVPVVDTNFINQLTAAGLSYKIVYPIQDNGNGRAYIVWASNDVPSNSTSIGGVFLPTIAGYARIEGVTWQNQFQPFTFTPVTGDLLFGGSPFGGSPLTFPQGDVAGDAIDALQSPLRETTLRLSVPEASNTVGTSTSGFSVTMVTDAWLAALPPPPAPRVPPVLAAPDTGAPPPPINVGGPGIPFAAGPAAPVNNTRNVIPFDVLSFCETGGPGGSPHSASWIATCIANAQ